jgi:hypothetical protein
MGAALTAPFAVAALVLCVAGVAKLRSPDGAVRALIVLGLPSGRALVRAIAAVEVSLGAWALLSPRGLSAGGVAAVYATFCVVSLVLAVRRAACGCFGDGDGPASVVQSLLSAGLGAIAVGAAFAPAHGIAWVLGRGLAPAAIMIAGIAAAAYATVTAYTQLPAAWSAWSLR